MSEHDSVQLEDNSAEAEQLPRYEAPRILFREPLEGVAAACTPTPPGKADMASCSQLQS